MARWQCKACGSVIDNGEITRPENALKEITENVTACLICESKQGYTNLDYNPSGIILPGR